MKKILLGLLLASIIMFSLTNLTIAEVIVQENASASTTYSYKTIGSDRAKVTTIMFTDFQDPFSSQWYTSTLPQIKDNYISKGLVRLQIKHFPLSFHVDAFNSAIAADTFTK